MGTVQIISIVISVAALLFSIFFNAKSSKRTDTKDIEERVRVNTEINMKLDSISNNVVEIKKDISSVKDDLKDHNIRIIKLEEKVHVIEEKVGI